MAERTSERGLSKDLIGQFFTRFGLAFFAILIIVVFALIEPKFLTFKNVMNILVTTSVMAISSMGVTVVMSTGDIDFAAGAELTLVTVVLGVVLGKTGIDSYPIGILIALAFAVIIGAINAFLHAQIGIPAFIATMGVSLIASGLAYGLTQGQYYQSAKWGSVFRVLGQGYIFGTIPMPVVILVIIAVIMWIYSEKTKRGRIMYAVGSNLEATKYIGIDAKRQKFEAFIICSVLCGIAGIIQGSQLNRVGFGMGDSTLFQAITAIMLGATFLKPGVFNIPGTLLGSLIVILFLNGFTMVSSPAWLRDVILGLVMLTSVSIVISIRRKSEHNY